MICFCDSDAVFKLAAFELLLEALSVLSATPKDLFILTETGKLCDDPKMSQRYGRSAVSSVKALAQQAEAKPGQIDYEELTVLSNIEKIDVGEATLFASTNGCTNFLIITHDKNSLRALTENPECKAIHFRICGHVVVLEQLLLKILAKYPYGEVRRKLLRSTDSVGALKRTLGANRDATKLQVENELNYDLEILRRETNFILA